MLKEGRVKALGAMSGTSLDGVDAAILDTDGEAIYGFGRTAYLPYTPQEQSVLAAALGKWGPLEAASELVETAHARVLSGFEDFDVVGFHGQTVAHDPDHGRTHQIGNGQILAEVLQKPVVWDFRTSDMKLGGQGAPLASFYHFALAKYLDLKTPVAFLNLGGVGNVTWVDPRKDKPEDEGALLAFDTGPANAPINDVMQARFGCPFDRGGDIAAQGEVDTAVIDAFLAGSYFAKIPPKSLDRDSFSDLSTAVQSLSDKDAVATLTQAVVSSIINGMQFFPDAVSDLIVCGGGRKNKTIMTQLDAAVVARVQSVEAFDLDGDMLEAQAFAHLAVRVARGLPTSCPTTTGVAAAVGGGTISTPRVV